MVLFGFSLMRRCFGQDQNTNRKCHIWLCAELAVAPKVMHTKFPASIMVWGVVSNEKHDVANFFFYRA